MGDEFFRMSTVTGKKYNIFETVKILNINQCIYYMQNGFYPVDIKISQNEKENKCLVFYYDKNETKKIYEDWRNLRK
jgi:hypothetical protein